MDQTLNALVTGRVLTRTLPDPLEELAPGVKWGRAEALFTPAFWAAQVWILREQNWRVIRHMRSGETLEEEVAACLLGGYGIRGELSHAAFVRLRDRGLLGKRAADEESIVQALREALPVGDKAIHYRFPRAKGKLLASCLSNLRSRRLPTTSDVAFRDALLELPGVGLKTASWITRNWLQSDRVAILDIHVQRAGQIMGLFRAEDRLPRDYLPMERRFLAFADALGEPASVLDLVIWTQMRQAPSVVVQMLASVNVNTMGRAT